MPTDPQAIVAQIDAALLESAARGFPLSYSISGRELQFQSLEQHTKLPQTYASMAADQGRGAKRSYIRLPGGPAS